MTTEHMIDCRACGVENDPWDRTCDTCGQRLGPPERKPTWPSNGTGPGFCVYPEVAGATTTYRAREAA